VTIRTLAVAAMLSGAAVGLAGCGHGTAAPPASGAAVNQQQPSELSSIQTTLDNIDQEMSGDGSP
jgi:hypothetical protein